MRVKKADRQLLTLLGIGLCVLVLWWAVSRGGSSPGAAPDGPGTTAPTSVGAATTSTPHSTPAASGGRGSTAHTPAAVTPDSGLPTIRESDLPREGRATLALIRAGGPFPYSADDGVFTNRERILPRRANGYYREYTVVTPGSPDRGPRRIIGGAEGDCYYTADHYVSFRQIEEGQ